MKFFKVFLTVILFVSAFSCKKEAVLQQNENSNDQQVVVKSSSTIVLDVREFGAVADAVPRNKIEGTSCTSFIQKALDSAAKCGSGQIVVDGANLLYRVDTSLVIPEGVTLQNISLQAGTDGQTVVYVKDDCTFNGKIIGRGTISSNAGSLIGETGIAAFSKGIDNVTINAHIQYLTIGIKTYVNGVDDYCKNWTTNLTLVDIVGKLGLSEGYGALLLYSENFSGLIEAYNVARHVLYLTAGSTNHKYTVYSNGCYYAPVVSQAFTDVGQKPSRGHTIKLFAKNIGPGNLSLPDDPVTTYVGAVRGCHDSSFEIKILDENPKGAKYAFYCEAMSSQLADVSLAAFPKNVSVKITGNANFPGISPVYCLGGENINVTMNGTYSGKVAIILYGDPKNPSGVAVNPAAGKMGLRVLNSSIDIVGQNYQGQDIIGIYNLSSTTQYEYLNNTITGTNSQIIN